MGFFFFFLLPFLLVVDSLILSGRRSLLSCPLLTQTILQNVNLLNPCSVHRLAAILQSHSFPLARLFYQRYFSLDEAHTVFSIFLKYRDGHEALLPMRYCVHHPHFRVLIFAHWSEYAPSEIHLSAKVKWKEDELDKVSERLSDDPRLLGSEMTKWIVFGHSTNNPFSGNALLMKPGVVELITAFYSSSQCHMEYEHYKQSLSRQAMIPPFAQNMLSILNDSQWVANVQANIRMIVALFSDAPKWEAYWHAKIILTVLNVAKLEKLRLTKGDRRKLAVLIFEYLRSTPITHLSSAHIHEILVSGNALRLRLRISPKEVLNDRFALLKGLHPHLPSLWGSVSDYLQSWRHMLYANLSAFRHPPIVLPNRSCLVKWWAAYRPNEIAKYIHLSPLLPYPVHIPKLNMYAHRLSILLNITSHQLINHGGLFHLDAAGGRYEWRSSEAGSLCCLKEGRAFARFVLTYLAYYGHFPSVLSPSVVSDLLQAGKGKSILDRHSLVLSDIIFVFRQIKLFTFLPSALRSKLVVFNDRSSQIN